MTRTLKVFLFTLITFGCYFFLDDLYFSTLRKILFEQINQFGVSHIIAYAVFGIPILIGTIFIHRKTKLLPYLGLHRSLFEGLLFALICTAPMFIGFFFVFNYNAEISLDNILITVLASAIFEEIYFRGFLFGQLYRYTNLGFIPSVLFGALLFAAMHLYQSTEIGESIGIFAVTFLGAVLFAWLFVEWKYNLWIPIFLHMLMNLSWGLFSVSDTAFGGIYSNVFRIATIALAIGLTLLYKKKKEIKLAINKYTIWMKKARLNELS